jgi:hypothetical protein
MSGTIEVLVLWTESRSCSARVRVPAHLSPDEAEAWALRHATESDCADIDTDEVYIHRDSVEVEEVQA